MSKWSLEKVIKGDDDPVPDGTWKLMSDGICHSYYQDESAALVEYDKMINCEHQKQEDPEIFRFKFDHINITLTCADCGATATIAVQLSSLEWD